MGGGVDDSEGGVMIAGGKDLADEIRMGTGFGGEFGELFRVSVGEAAGDGGVCGENFEGGWNGFGEMGGEDFEAVGDGDFGEGLGGGVEFVTAEGVDDIVGEMRYFLGSDTDRAGEVEGFFVAPCDAGLGGFLWDRRERDWLDVALERDGDAVSVLCDDLQGGAFEVGCDGLGYVPDGFRSQGLSCRRIADAPCDVSGDFGEGGGEEQGVFGERLASFRFDFFGKRIERGDGFQGIGVAEEIGFIAVD